MLLNYTIILFRKAFFEPLAQSVEHLTFNQGVPRSSRGWLTIINICADVVIAKPDKYSRATSYGAAGYIKNIAFDKETGEILSPKKLLELDIEKLEAEEALDGYYAIVTSEYKESSNHIIDIYRGLWRIEESFRVTKSDLEAQPVYVSRKEHIQAHFLTCFIALIIGRIMELKLEHKYSIGRILESLAGSTCTHMKQNYYLFDYFDDVLEAVEQTFKIDFSKRVRSLGEIKKILAATKKG